MAEPTADAATPSQGTRSQESSSPLSARIPVTLLTGFLGSGKTTLLNRALRAPEMTRALVIINEFGEIGLDHALAETSDDAVIVLENGCLCCTVRSDLVGTLNRLYHDRAAERIPYFDRVVIETSGLAEPGPVLQAFLSEPTLDGLYRVANVIALVDAVNGAGTLAAHDEAVRQVALADTIILTKLDLLPPAEHASAAEALRATLARLNPAATLLNADDPRAAISELFRQDGFDAANPDADPRPWLKLDAHARPADDACDVCGEPGHDHHHHGDAPHAHRHHHHGHHAGFGGPGEIDLRIESFCLIRDEPLSRTALQFLLDGISQNLGPNLLRVKGLVNVAEEPGRPAVIQGAQHLLHTMTWLAHWPDADERTRIVFITQGVARAALEEMILLLDRVAARTAKARQTARQTADAGPR